MALLHLLTPPLSLTSPPSPSPPRRRALSLAISANLYLRLQQNNPVFNQSSQMGSAFPLAFLMAMRESKQQMILEQRLKMKLAKKLRLRRKRLVRKRRLRKKGRWPPSKMKKLKNV
uniref:50S ribosomal protein 5, chloroplastic n=1 Tax=Ananas comosus var. bracteatus TaxID=296719 RepID=A0A6V7PQV0_ANACO|nr:unnamed protein product [Ananas comosus var. bracteatus]